MIGKIILFFMLLFLSSACEHSKKSIEKFIEIDINSLCSINDFFDHYDFVALETTKNNIIGEITKIELDSNHIYILDQNQNAIFIFNRDGRYYNKIDKQGRAWDEYLFLDDFAVHDSTIYCLSRANKKIYAYSKGGILKDCYILNDWYNKFTIWDDSLMFLYSEKSNERCYDFIVYDYKNDNYLNKFDPFQVNEGYGFRESPFHWSGQTLFVTDQYSGEIYSLTPENKLLFCRLDFNTQDRLPENYKQMKKEELSNFLRNKEALRCINQIHLNDNYLTIVCQIFYAGSGIRNSIVRIDLETEKVKFIRLGDVIEPNFPFIQDVIGIYQDEIVSYASVISVREKEKILSKDILKGIQVSEMDNPLLFFHKIKY